MGPLSEYRNLAGLDVYPSRVLSEGTQYVHTTSPGRGSHHDGKGSKRLQVVDSGAPATTPKDLSFHRAERLRTRGKGGKLLKKPRKVVTNPGADDGVVAFVDYDKEGHSIYLDLVAVRPAYRGKRLAQKLIREVYKIPGIRYVRWGRILNAASFALFTKAKEAHPDIVSMGKKFY